MSSSPPPRRFAPEPVETTTKSSKERGNVSEEKPKARRFAPEPVETSTKSSKTAKKEPEPSDVNGSNPRRFLPQPVETTTKSSRKMHEPETGDLTQPRPRKFAPQPVETSSKSSKDRKSLEGNNQKPRRFAPQPIETSSRSSRGSSPEKNDKPKPKSRFAPQPIEHMQSSSKGRQQQGAPHISFNLQTFDTQGNSSSKPAEQHAPEDPVPEQKKVATKFRAILLDTARRSRRAHDSTRSLSASNKTEYGYKLAAKEHRRHITGNTTPAVESSSDSDVEMADVDEKDNKKASQPFRLRPLAPLDGGHPVSSRFSERSHSFRLPELDTIESSASEKGSQASSESSSPVQGSPITASDSSYPYPYPGFKDATRIRESVDENFHNYLLKLEAKRAEERMREAALAAFPNSDFHEPVMHYVDEEETESEHSIEDRPSTWEGHEDDEYVQKARRESTKVPWEQLEMQRHHERMEQERKANQTTAKQATKQASQGPWWNPALQGGMAPDRDFKGMQDRARPPMLGGDLRFPRCRSPSPARFDVTQGSTALRNQMCYLTEHADSHKEEDEEPHLWQGEKPKPQPHFTSIKTPRTTQGSPSQENKKGGLWGGFCAQDGERSPNHMSPPPGAVTGLLTPRYEAEENPFDQSFKGGPAADGIGPEGPIIKTPPAAMGKGPSNKDLGNIDAVLVSEKDLDETMEKDYPDSFITQVYNYLSLGYPSLARPFDAELSKISRFPIADLRQDDKKAKQQPRGYIRLGPDFEGGGGEVSEANCMRWQALKVYVREWARQEKNMVKTDGVFGNFGTAARRGSWAG